ncbi:calcium-binding protein [Oleomonas cavernae]|uniref:Calcium-binding protein n=1 Tax=Oleomonas cavernae TaxID=2320859 RepID=A0A418WD89_9PROT|nr:calcium-binding protein [Oleomonas cavernae]RJF87997.1 calcium-binding protein [Oleomonas cavernae]
MATFNGTAGNDLIPALLPDTLFALGNDTMNGLAGNDTLVGWTGNDVLNGGSGVDTLIGGIINIAGHVGTLTVTGLDTATYVDSSKRVIVDLGTVNNFVLDLGGILVELTNTTVGSGGDAQGDKLAGITNLTGSDFDDQLGGNTLANTLIGGLGDDTLHGGVGGDTLNGGSGIDTISYEGSSAGVAIDLSTGAAALGDAAGDIITSIENVIGSSFDDAIKGSSVANRLYGEGGSDVLDGQGGKDVLLGGFGADALSGGAGDDALKGDEGDDGLSGGDGRDRLVGGGGNDTMTGGTGSDIYFVDDAGDTVIEFVGEGTDRVYASVSYSLGNSAVEILVLRGSATDGNGNEFNNTIVGNELDNVLTGAGGVDRIKGMDGNDLIDAGIGNNRVLGGLGADTFEFSSLGAGTTTIGDWESGPDKIALDADVFGLAAGPVTVVNGTSAVGLVGDVFFYQTNTGRIFFHDGDADTLTRFASLGSDRPASLDAGDFVLV